MVHDPLGLLSVEPSVPGRLGAVPGRLIRTPRSRRSSDRIGRVALRERYGLDASVSVLRDLFERAASMRRALNSQDRAREGS